MYWVFAGFNWVFVQFILGNTTFLLYFLYNINYFNWVFVKFILGNTTFLLYFLYNINYFNWVSINVCAYCYQLLQKQLSKYSKKLICFSGRFWELSCPALVKHLVKCFTIYPALLSSTLYNSLQVLGLFASLCWVLPISFCISAVLTLGNHQWSFLNNVIW
mgnify:CR=1 FL=1